MSAATLAYISSERRVSIVRRGPQVIAAGPLALC
jgi:hypothetical protein